MSKFPIINRSSPVKLLDTDYIGVLRRLPNGEIFSFKINICDISQDNKLPGLDEFEESEGEEKISLTKKFRTTVTVLPILPNKSGYGITKSIGEILWINNSYEADVASLTLLKEIKKETKEEWWAQVGSFGPMSGDLRTKAIELHEEFVVELDALKTIIVTMSNTFQARKTELLNASLKTLNVSSLTTWIKNAAIVIEAIDSAIADANAKILYLKEGPPKGEKGEDKKKGEYELGEEKLIQ